METAEKILAGKICPYCYEKTDFIDSSFVYGKSYGMIYICKPCRAYVGVHKGTNKALGRLANAELREAKKEAHKYFDSLWKSKMMKRQDAYKWLSEQLGIDRELCHIGMFDVDLCEQVVSACKNR